MTNYFDMFAKKTANIGDVVYLRGQPPVIYLEPDGSFSVTGFAFTVIDISPDGMITCTWIAKSTDEVHKWDFPALALNFSPLLTNG